MMSRIKLNRTALAFSEAAKASFRPCDGDEYSHGDSSDLSDLVKSFLEKDCWVETVEGKILEEEEEENEEFDHSSMKRLLQSLLRGAQDGNQEDDVKQKISKETELACRIGLSRDFKRQLMSHLRDKGFDAGLCKSRWEKSGRQIAGNYEYLDVNVNGSRYILEVNLAAEFKIARPTNTYASLLEVFPPIFIGRPKELKQIVTLMSKAMRKSMKSREMPMPPWRLSEYMKSKWFARYRRTSNETPSRNTLFDDSSTTKMPVGFGATAIPTMSFHCRDNFASKSGLKVGFLAAALNCST